MYDYEIFRSNYKNNLKRHIQIKIFSVPLHNMLLRKHKKVSRMRYYYKFIGYKSNFQSFMPRRNSLNILCRILKARWKLLAKVTME